MKNVFFLLFMGATSLANAQYSIGHTSMSFFDPTRNDREIPCEIYYPSDSEGEDVDLANGSFPQVIFGHGFVMGYDAYQNIWEAIVPEGFVMAFPTTEGGFPDHAAFGLDLAFVAAELEALTLDASSMFYGHLSDAQAIGGHSMGGGATWLAAANTISIECIFGLAPAETNPSAIEAAAEVEAPALVISGSADDVTPPGENHQPIYDETDSPCRFFVSLVEGSHCYFANPGSLCDLGEFFPGSMTREVQQMHTHALLLNWFSWWLLDAGGAGFTAYAEGFPGVLNTSYSCAAASVEEEASLSLKLWPNPFGDRLFLQLPCAEAEIRISSGGRIIVEKEVRALPSGGVFEVELDREILNALAPGAYELTVRCGNTQRTEMIIRR